MALNRDPSHRELGTQRWKNQRLKVLKRDGYICQYCGEEATQVDHVISRARGGGHELENLVACCAKCNQLKGASSDAVFSARSATPLALAEHLSLTRSKTMLDSPFKIRPKPIT